MKRAATMTRRDMVRALATAAAATLPAAWPACREPAEPQRIKEPLNVALIPCPDYGAAGLAQALRRGFDSTLPPEVRAKRVLIKPNIADFVPARPISTDVRLVEALVLFLREAGAREVVIAEGPPHNRDTEWLFRQTGYEDLSRRLQVPLLDLNTEDVRPVRNANPRATALRDLYLPEAVLSADVIISVPKMKTHKLAGVTLSLKNMFGIVPGLKYGWPKNALHWNGIPLSICEINGTVKTHFSIVDGIVGMEGHGPIMGTPRPAGVLVMGDNALAVDATAARVMGIDPARVEYLALAQTVKLGSLRAEDIVLAGETVERARTDFLLAPDFARLKAPLRS